MSTLGVKLLNLSLVAMMLLVGCFPQPKEEKKEIKLVTIEEMVKNGELKIVPMEELTKEQLYQLMVDAEEQVEEGTPWVSKEYLEELEFNSLTNEEIHELKIKLHIH